MGSLLAYLAGNMLLITLYGTSMSQRLGDLLMDAEWRGLLRQRLDVHEDAKDFWMDIYHLKQYPDLDEKGQEALKRLS